VRNTSPSRRAAAAELVCRRTCRNRRPSRRHAANATRTSRSERHRGSSDRPGACARDARRRSPATPCRVAGYEDASPARSPAHRGRWRPCAPRSRNTRVRGERRRAARRDRRRRGSCTAVGGAPASRRAQATAGPSWDRVRICGASRTLARGSVRENTEPFPTSLRTVSSPRIPAANSRLIAKPSPVPP
jgi:hypothetical protein